MLAEYAFLGLRWVQGRNLTQSLAVPPSLHCIYGTLNMRRTGGAQHEPGKKMSKARPGSGALS